MSVAVSSSAPKISTDPALPNLVVESMRAIVKDSFERLALVNPENPDFDLTAAIEALQGGVWLTSDYIKAVRWIEKTTSTKHNWIPSEDALKSVLRGFAPTSHFNRFNNRILQFQSKPNVSPSDALDAAIKGPTLTDCGGTAQLALQRALRDYKTKEVYDRVMKGQLFIGPVMDKDPLFNRFLATTQKTAEKKIQISKGKLVCFVNHPNYVAKHRFGHHQNYHLTYAGSGRYLGLGLPPEGITKQELTDLFVKEYNKKPSANLDGLVSEGESAMGLLGLMFQGIKQITEDVQITGKDVPGFNLETVQEFNLFEIEKF